MPTYSYRCNLCGATADWNRSVDSRDEPLPCNECAYPMTRTITAAPVHFKGTGFYKTGG